MEVEEESLRSLNLLIKNVEKNVEHFITHDENQSSKILSGLREIYYLTKKEEAVCGRSIKGCPFERLQLDDTNFDVEIIWQQIQLQNECLLPKLSVEVKTLVNKPGTVFLRKEKPKMLATDLRTNKMESDSQILAQSDSEKGDCIIDNDSLCVEEVRHEGLEIPNITDKVQARMNEGSVVDDTFFKLDEMERFLESKYAGDGEMSDEDDDEENVDYFMDVNESKGLSKDKSNAIENIMYSDLFDYPEDLNTKLGDDKKDDNEKHILEKVAKHNDNERDTNKLNEDNFNDGRSKSTLEKQQEKVKKQIAALEQSNIATKSWQLSGETSASVRPQNSLLEEVLQFDHTMAPAPVITEERSKNLEDIITQRIKDNRHRAWVLLFPRYHMLSYVVSSIGMG
ncbi:U3 small nucleolar ribonucleoprotein protein MPP10-like isoform X2 [Xenia sp. Carnegie-2017]|uniref:U3 small nucleolar ribonucleoprotein protein MPP10-like isoform X2 n=1 Tax=Xenia sp. Carnegie-2017 TaxID=2897299 RepID=UPI001F042D7D|nr:U3 small nucleolar ribonucleoprotein protein MPP10-like isoform X2 [Xenia sp. Carnegie-2017]